MLDVEGPGAIVRWWITQYKFDGTIRVYLDGAKEPVLQAKGNQLVGGEPGGAVGPPLAAMYSRGCNLYLPIPFAKHCKVTYDGANALETKKFADNLYYNINYLQYADVTQVKSFSRDELKAHAHLIDKVQRELIAPQSNGLATTRKVAGGKQVLQAGQSITRSMTEGGAIGLLRVKLNADDIGQAMRSTVIQIDFDGNPCVWAPVGGFFGSGPGLSPFKGWWRQIQQDGWMTCWWPMPFKESAVLTITNHGTSDVTVELGDIGLSDWKWTSRTMNFHCAWRGDDHIPVFGNNYHLGEEWNYLTARGQGVYVGDTMAVFNRPLQEKNSWWGEGDEKIYVDGELFPSHFGTGTEDYFGYAWGTAALFEAPLHAQPRGDANKGSGHTTNTRTRILDRIPFKQSFKMNMELMHWRSGGTVDYATTTYWYARGGADGNGQTSPARVRRRVGQIDAE
jgi:hypothetical protein